MKTVKCVEWCSALYVIITVGVSYYNSSNTVIIVF